MKKLLEKLGSTRLSPKAQALLTVVQIVTIITAFYLIIGAL